MTDRGPKTGKRRSYPGPYDKLIPVLLAFIAVAAIAVLAIAIAAAVGLIH